MVKNKKADTPHSLPRSLSNDIKYKSYSIYSSKPVPKKDPF